ncbi:ADP-ribosylation factor-like protein 3 [Thelohanellus kitauei]|uniref:ADP-ribosylation factor-like protein 3 n=1 Tax=Thelohanellus kitauei TaxID=669202 RepID=A0A0C2IKZ4_THEKT|nr:ADP-ribosylation factor-like protein 3 [Thelohanellus kitauei]
MGNTHSKHEYELGIVVLGMESSGKTYLVNKMMDKNDDRPTQPTLTFGEHHYPLKGKIIRLVECGGSEQIQQLWSHYLESIKGLIFVVDSTGADKFQTAGELLKTACLRCRDKTPILLVCTKSDLEGAVTPDEVASKMQIGDVKQPVKPISVSAKTNQGLQDIHAWIKATYKNKDT